MSVSGKKKKWLFWGIGGVLLLLIVIGWIISGMDLSVTAITPLTTQVNIDLNDVDSAQKDIDVTVTSISNDIPIDDLRYISNNPECAKIEYVSHDASKTFSNLTVRIIGVSKGETTCYIKTANDSMKSQEITVKVTGDAAATDIKNFEKKSVNEFMAKINEMGYTAKYIHAQSNADFSSEVKMFSQADLRDKWVIAEIKKIDTDKKTVECTINTKQNIENATKAEENEKALSTKISSSYAYQAVEEYGKVQYPYGFKLHYFMGQHSAQAVDENTWFIKCEATVTNQYNAKISMMCEANVSGTNDTPLITNFKVY